MDKRILAIDDEPQIITLIRDILSLEGYRVDGALRGYEALNMLSVNSYDLIMMDMRMPGINGKELYKNIMDRYPHLLGRIIVITGDIARSMTHVFFKKKGCPCLYKPFTIGELKMVVDNVLKGYRAETGIKE